MRLVALALVSAVLVSGAGTQTPPLSVPSATAPGLQRIHGTISAYDPVLRSLSIASGKSTVQVTLPQDLRIVYNQRRKVADLKQGDYIGTAALKAADGKLHAQQIAVFPDSLRGTGEGQYAMGDPASNRIMTNATIAAVTASAPNSGILGVNYRGDAPGADGTCTGHANSDSAAGCSGHADIVVAPGVPIIALMLGDESLLIPGAAVSLVASSGSGSLEATRLTVEKDGVKPVL
ncbi:MAG: hypothetical protein JO261_03915 [Alphaproteobacteria bacterium]|nr:hypothetical protein [Alphaproteobacteria bacterium]MBV9692827.1 hypothetical protein [Alphaproteobacteria bacterium]